MRRKKVSWCNGDVFAIPLDNGKYSIGHILDQRLINTIRIALFDEVIESINDITVDTLCDIQKLISLIEVTKEQVEYGVWKIIGKKESLIAQDKYANEKFRKNDSAGSKVYDAALAEDFVNAFYALIPWDDWFNPDYLDNFLVDKSKKPSNLIYIK